MKTHIDILDTRESLRGPFTQAITLHLSVIAALVLYGWISRHGEQFGDRNPSGGAVAVEVVNSIPIPHEGMQNPVASDTQSQVPQTPLKEKNEVKKEVPPPDAVKLHNPKAKQKPAEKTQSKNMFRPYVKLPPNQLTSATAPQANNQMFSAKAGSGNVGTGMNTTLGTRFAGYSAQIRDIIARNWHTSDVDAHIQSAPQVVVSFELMRDGSIRNVTMVQLSNIPSLDASVKRAILDSNPLPPIPSEFTKDSAKVEFTFELKR